MNNSVGIRRRCFARDNTISSMFLNFGNDYEDDRNSFDSISDSLTQRLRALPSSVTNRLENNIPNTSEDNLEKPLEPDRFVSDQILIGRQKEQKTYEFSEALSQAVLHNKEIKESSEDSNYNYLVYYSSDRLYFIPSTSTEYCGIQYITKSELFPTHKLSAEALREIEKLGLSADVESAIDIAKSKFSTLHAIDVTFEHDPEIADRKTIAFNLSVSGEPETVLKDEHNFKCHLRSKIGIRARELITLTYEWRY